MTAKNIHVQNFRSILDSTLPYDQLTVLDCANGAEKSSFLGAIEMFYSYSPRGGIDDFYKEEGLKDIVVTMTFGDLRTEAKIGHLY
jgi:predicted ATPase